MQLKKQEEEIDEFIDKTNNNNTITIEKEEVKKDYKVLPKMVKDTQKSQLKIE